MHGVCRERFESEKEGRRPARCSRPAGSVSRVRGILESFVRLVLMAAGDAVNTVAASGPVSGTQTARGFAKVWDIDIFTKKLRVEGVGLRHAV